MDVIRVNKSAITAVEDYLEYRRIVGEDDGGRLFTSEQYEAYKQQVLPARLQNRLYVSCGVPGGMDCKLIGPETLCFCSHRYKQHQTDFEKLPLSRPLALPCRVPGCLCTSYSYIYLNGSQPVRCRCKHSAQDHSEAGRRRCRKCSACAAFCSPYTCSCGQPSYAHKTLVEMKEERLARGMPVGKDVPYVAMGGLTGFSSLAEDFPRLENRGLGNPPYCGMELAGSRPSVACGFEKVNGACSQTADINSLKQKSDLKTREEEDMAIFERRYKERILANGIAVWFGNITQAERKALQRVIKAADMNIGADLKSMLEMDKARRQKVLALKGTRPSATPQRNPGKPEG